MQSVIENGRLIRERKNISLKVPLQSVTLIDQDEEALKDFKFVEVYILDELNCLELKTETKEDEFVEYKCEPDHMLMGQALKKQFDKKFKADILKLPSSWLRDYLKNGSGMIGDIKIEENWLKVDKLFNDKMKQSKEVGCSSDKISCVMIDTVINENLKLLGQAREIRNRIQKLRKSTGISIDDQIEVYHERKQTAGQKTMLSEVLDQHSERIQKDILMPFQPCANMPAGAVLIGTTEYESPENKEDVVTLYICRAQVHVIDDEVSKLLQDGPTTLGTVHSYLNSFDSEELLKEVTSNGGSLKINLDKKDFELKHKVHFFLNAKERWYN